MPFNLAERFISAAEKTLGAPLPHSYRQEMMASNGGEVAAYDDVWRIGKMRSGSGKMSLEGADQRRAVPKAPGVCEEQMWSTHEFGIFNFRATSTWAP